MRNIKRQLNSIRQIVVDNDHSKELPEVGAGGYLMYDGSVFEVRRVYRYLDVKWSSFAKRKRDYWVTELELYDVLTGDVRHIEWEIDDDIEVCETTHNIKLSEIQFAGRPITRSDLVNIAENEFGSVEVDGIVYDYSEDDTWAALFYRNPNSEPLPVRMYEFRSSDGVGLTIEAWEDEEGKPEREAFLSEEVSQYSFDVIQTGPIKQEEQL